MWDDNELDSEEECSTQDVDEIMPDVKMTSPKPRKRELKVDEGVSCILRIPTNVPTETEKSDRAGTAIDEQVLFCTTHESVVITSK